MTRIGPVGRAAAALGPLLLLLLAAGSSCSRKGKPDPASRHGARPAESPDVVLITLDTVRSDALGFSGNQAVQTPGLDRLATEGLVFDRAYASNVVTLPSHVNILTGLYPHQHGVRDNSGFRLDPKISTLATMLSERGYSCGAFVGAFPLDSRYGLNRGFSVYDERYPASPNPYHFEVRERSASEVIAAARGWYEKARGKKRFLWIHLYDAHAPYRPPAPLAERYRDNPYLGEIAAIDVELTPLFDVFRQAGAGKTLVVLTSDHGEALGDHGERTHGLFAYEATLRVPLVIWLPGRVATGRRTSPARHVDILPTVLGVVGAPAPSALPGRSLLEDDRKRDADEMSALYFEALSTSLNRGWAPLTGALEGNWKYIDLPIPELYDLAADPEEKKNLASERRDVLRRLKPLIPPHAARAEAAAAGNEETRRLLSLGYLSGSAARKTEYETEDDPKRLVGLDGKIHDVIELYQAGQLARATALAREVLAARPGMAVGYEFLSFLLQQGGREAEAASLLRAAIQKGLASEAMRVRLALVLSEAGRPREALEVLEPLKQSQDPDTGNALGIALADVGRTPEALAAFGEVLRVHPANAEALQNRAITFLKAGNARSALQEADRALAANDKLPRAWNARGVALAQLGRATEAIESWRRAVALDPRLYDALFNIGILAARQEDSATAVEALRRFLQSAPPALYQEDLATARRLLRQLGRG